MTGALSVQGVSKRFGGLLAVDGISFDVAPGELVSIIGPNGAGKTTLFNLLTGQLAPSTGRVLLDGQDVSGIPEAARHAAAMLDLVGLGHRAGTRAGVLTLSERRRLEVARALALDPKIVLLDEVMAGLNQTEIHEIVALVQHLNREGHTFLVIEHNLKVVRQFSHRVIVLERGAMLAEGTAEDVLSNPRVVEAYVGKGRQP